MKKTAIVSVLSLLLFAGIAHAADVITPTGQDSSINIPQDEIHKNLYVAAPNLTLNGPITGDAVAAGGTVTIDNAIEQDLLLAGGNVSINGSVGGDARVAGGNISFTAPIGGDAVVAGGTANFGSGASVGGDLLLAVGTADIEAPVKGSIKATGGIITIDSPVSGTIAIRNSKQLIFGPHARISGTVYYFGPQAPQVQNGAKVGTIEFTQVKSSYWKEKLLGLISLFFLLKLISLMLVCWLVLLYKRLVFFKFAGQFKTNFWKLLGIGFVVCIVMPIAALILLFLIVGYYAAFILLAAFGLLVLFSTVVGALLLGQLIVSALSKPGEIIPDWQIVLIGAVLWSVLPIIPIAGFLIKLVVGLVAAGMLALHSKAYFTNKEI